MRYVWRNLDLRGLIIFSINKSQIYIELTNIKFFLVYSFSVYYIAHFLKPKYVS